MSNPVLICGAGPTGLVLALWLTKIGIKVRLIDKAVAPGTSSRALVVHSRTLEFYGQLGLAADVERLGFRFPRINLWLNKKIRARAELGSLGQGLTPYPYVLIFPQDRHEEYLIAKLKELGVEVERQTELISFTQTDEEVRSEIRLPTGQTEQFTSAYLAGCDGARSIVRSKLDTGFAGSTYPDMFYVADIEGTGEALNGELHPSLDESEFIVIFPLKDRGHARFIGVIRADDSRKLTWDDVSKRLINEMNIKVDKVHWFSTYHVHHRVASHFQDRRVFLCGDAGHIHSPVGGQGMNTGIGDAVNLAWKLGDVIKGKAGRDLLDTYEPERIAFARALVRTTDQAFRLISSDGWIARFVRTRLTPLLLPMLVKSLRVRKFVFRRISQTAITYRQVKYNKGSAGSLHAGDRLPWVKSVNNYEPLKSLDWQIHIYGDKKILRDDVKVFNFPWSKEAAEKGLKENVVYRIRPDGHIGAIIVD